MLKAAKQMVKKILSIYPQWVCRREFRNQAFNRFNERPVELSFVFEKIKELYPRRILDVGSGTTALPHLMRNCGCLVTATDNIRDYWPNGAHNRHYHVIDDDITATGLSESYEFITCISVLEHIRKADDAVRNLLSLLKPGGHLILTFPYSEGNYVENVYDLPGSSYGKGAAYITQSFSRRELERWFAGSQVTIVNQEYWLFWEGEQWTVGEQVIPPKQVAVNERHQLTCIHVQKNGT